MTRHTLNIIARGFAGGEPSSARKRYARTMVHVRKKSPSEERENQTTITFSKKDVERVLPHEYDLMVIKVKIRN